MIARLPGTPRDQPPPLVLVADEDPKVVEALVAALQEHHFRVSVASDGEEALTRARGESPDLIIAGVRLARRSSLTATYRHISMYRFINHGDDRRNTHGTR